MHSKQMDGIKQINPFLGLFYEKDPLTFYNNSFEQLHILAVASFQEFQNKNNKAALKNLNNIFYILRLFLKRSKKEHWSVVFLDKNCQEYFDKKFNNSSLLVNAKAAPNQFKEKCFLNLTLITECWIEQYSKTFFKGPNLHEFIGGEHFQVLIDRFLLVQELLKYTTEIQNIPDKKGPYQNNRIFSLI